MGERMGLTIIDTYPEMMSLIEKMGETFQKPAWEQYLEDISSELLLKVTKDSSDYDYENEILPVMNLLLGHMEKIEKAYQSFLTIIEDLDTKIMTKTGSALQAQLVFYIGLCNGAGWVTTLDGKPTVLLGVEKIIELNWYDKETMTALIYHELGHVWHYSVGSLQSKTSTMGEKYIKQLVNEGIAMYFEQLLMEDFNYYHQNINGWLDWCIAHKDELDLEFLRRLKTNSSAQDFFGDWQKYKGYSDLGYFIGCEFVKWMLDKKPLKKIANMDTENAYKEFQKYVEER